MTNGEMMKAIFPSAEIDIGNGGNDIWIAIDCWTIFKKEWWDAEYKEPTTKNDLGVDCISRQAVEDAMYDATRAMDLNYGQIMEYIDNLPSVTPQPRKGHWIPIRVDRYSEQYGHFKINEYKCSNCNSEFEYGYHNYCPYCGAKMVEPQESEGQEDD